MDDDARVYSPNVVKKDREPPCKTLNDVGEYTKKWRQSLAGIDTVFAGRCAVKDCIFSIRAMGLVPPDLSMDWLHGDAEAVRQAIDRISEWVVNAGKSANSEENQTELVPAQYLASWREILVALGMKNNKEDQAKVRTLSKSYGGPIVFPGQGAQPKAEKAELLTWWNSLAAKFTTQGTKSANASATVAEQYKYGDGTTVIPDISGAVKERRKVSRKKT